MYKTLKRLYEAGKITEAGLVNAVSKGWITSDQKDTIIGG